MTRSLLANVAGHSRDNAGPVKSRMKLGILPLSYRLAAWYTDRGETVDANARNLAILLTRTMPTTIFTNGAPEGTGASTDETEPGCGAAARWYSRSLKRNRRSPRELMGSGCESASDGKGGKY